MKRGWIGVDFDGTLRREADGLPVSLMVTKIGQFLAQGIEVRIVTARVNSKMPKSYIFESTCFIRDWCLNHIGAELEVTAEKDYEMIALYDDRAIAVKHDSGECRGWNEELEILV